MWSLEYSATRFHQTRGGLVLPEEAPWDEAKFPSWLCGTLLGQERRKIAR